MTKQEVSKKAQRLGDVTVWLTRILNLLIMVGGLLVALWVQFLGPGVQSAVQNFVGVTEVVERLEYVERNMPPPPVVEWNERIARQIGNCTTDGCSYRLNGARTPYGENCGAPQSIVPYVRTAAGQNIQVSFPPDRAPAVELTRDPTSFTVHLRIPSYLSEGDHSWRARVIYPDCPGRGEPIPRWTPWFPLRVTTQ